MVILFDFPKSHQYGVVTQALFIPLKAQQIEGISNYPPVSIKSKINKLILI